MSIFIGRLRDVGLRVFEHLIHLFDLLQEVTTAPYGKGR